MSERRKPPPGPSVQLRGETSDRGSYGKLVSRLYEHFFGRAYEKKRIQIRRSLAAFADSNAAFLVEDRSTDLFPRVTVENRRFRANMMLAPSYDSLDRLELSFVLASRSGDMDEFPFPVVQVFSRNIVGRILRDRWMVDIDTGDSTFDYWFGCRALEVFPVDEFIGSPGKNLLFSLYYLFGSNNLYIECQGSKVLVKKFVTDDVPCSSDRLLTAYRQARILFRLLERNMRQRFRPGGGNYIRFLEAGEGAPLCRICGEPIFFNRILCARCDTPHHIDCWQYNGSCSIYGCGCRDYVFPRRD